MVTHFSWVNLSLLNNHRVDKKKVYIVLLFDITRSGVWFNIFHIILRIIHIF